MRKNSPTIPAHIYVAVVIKHLPDIIAEAERAHNDAKKKMQRDAAAKGAKNARAA